METKFHLLPVGQHFEWEGKSYVKITPLIANQVPVGTQKFMPRAAQVKVLGADPSPPPVVTPTSLDCITVRNAIARYHQRSVQISQSRIDPRQEEIIGEVRQELEQLYRDLLAELKL